MLELTIYLSCIKATQAVCEQSYFLTTVVLDFKGLTVKMMVKISSSDLKLHPETNGTDGFHWLDVPCVKMDCEVTILAVI